MSKKLSPTQAVKAHCTECLGLNQFNKTEIENCKGDTCFTGPCLFYPYRLGKRMPVKIFRTFCTHCMGGQRDLVAGCTSPNCKVYPYRFGKNPARHGIGNYDARIGRKSKEMSQESTISGQGIGNG